MHRTSISQVLLHPVPPFLFFARPTPSGKSFCVKYKTARGIVLKFAVEHSMVASQCMLVEAYVPLSSLEIKTELDTFTLILPFTH